MLPLTVQLRPGCSAIFGSISSRLGPLKRSFLVSTHHPRAARGIYCQDGCAFGFDLLP
jgi:hypothetical protein